jgi:site-specific DNA-methyltransferase (adenine-specific)
MVSYGDAGGASRFFPIFRYEAKATAAERPRGDDGHAHPTVKPLDLMRWLVRLVTRPGGLVLDPFGGSGTTAEACVIEGFRCVIIEKDPASAALIVKRLDKPIQQAMFGDEVA